MFGGRFAEGAAATEATLSELTGKTGRLPGVFFPYKNSLADPNWSPLGSSISGDGALHTVNDTIGQSSRFYRVALK
jgi:hypothetical protein